MRLIFIIIFSCLLQFLHAGGSDHYSQGFFPRPDTLPPPPPGQAAPISGPASACVGETSEYSVDVPVACTCQWAINGIIQPDTGSHMTIIWTQPGFKIVTVVFICAGALSEPVFKTVTVSNQPDVFLGNDTTILQGQTLVLDAGNPGSDYHWSTGDTTRTLPVSISGTYMVYVSNFCGTDADTIEVSVLVGIAEYRNSGDCFRVILQKGKIKFPELPSGILRIQVISISGMICYDGPPVSEIPAGPAGIYLIRVISAESACYQKIFVR
jgi:hypothetical protein